MAFKVTLLALIPGSLLLVLAAGCSSGPSFGNKQGIQPGPYGGQASRPGPVKQLASKVSDSSLGKSVSKVFQTTSTKKRKPDFNDPVSLATKTKPADADFYVDAGNVCAKDNDAESARVNYHKALEMKPHHLGALLGLARLFDRQGQLERATEHYLEAAKHHPGEAAIYNDLGLCYARQAKYDDAVKALSRAVELQPDRALYRNNIATVLVVQGRTNEALAHLTDAHGAAIAHYNIGFLLNKRGQRRQALEQFKLALQTDPSMTSAEQWIASLSSELAPESRQPVHIASGVQPGAETEERSEGPSLGPSMSPPSKEPAAGEAEDEVQVQDDEAPPSNQLREIALPEEPVSSPQGATSQPDAEPAASESKETAEPAQASVADEPAQKEAKLQYLPPVTPRSGAPSRY